MAPSSETNLGETSSPHPTQDGPVVETDPSSEVSVHQQPSPPQEAQQQAQAVLQPTPAVPPPEEAVQGPAAPPRVYTCMSCGKSYPTLHALGGHMVVHKKKQNQAEAVAAGAAHQAEGNVIPALARAREVPRKKHYQCSVCDRLFSTFMALGGHMRKHYKGPPIVHQNSMEPCVAPPPPVAPPALAPPAAGSVADDLTRVLEIITGQPPSHPLTPAGRLQEGTDIIRPQVAAPVAQEGTDTITPHDEAPREGSSSSAMTEVSAAFISGQLQDEGAEKSCADSPSKESSN